MLYNWGYEPAMRLAGRPTSRVSGVYGALVEDGAQMFFRMGQCILLLYPYSFTLSLKEKLEIT